ncbi:MAG TPA: M48 family metallopeptidase [Bryobacterales bacterium]|nr:M48 family metallopeptidase [Bryobacterales bacterium]
MITSIVSRLSKIALCVALAAGGLIGQQTVKPGWNLFSPEQDVQLGKEAAAEIEKEVTIVNDKELTEYVARIGKRLADASPAPEYPYTFKVVADPSVNAFALPGGPIYIHTGLITAADNEAQVAGVVAHEVGHVALRHSTSQASKAQIFQLPLVLAGGMLGKKGGMLGSLSQIGIGFGLNSVFMKYSRSAEKDADILGARMMADVGYDPVEMATFFQKLEAAGGGGGMPQFFSDHPNPGNRVNYVRDEIGYMPKKNYTTGNQGQFSSMKARAERVKIPEKPKPAAEAAPSGTAASTGTTAPGGNQRFGGAGFEIVHPSSWRAHSANQGAMVTLVPENGLVQRSNGQSALARGMIAGYFDSPAKGLSRRTDELITSLQKSNAGLRPTANQRSNTNLRGQLAQSVLLEGNSPLANQREIAWLVATERPQGLFYAVFIAPEQEYDAQRATFESILRSVTFP